ncbi:hypothetical protein DQ04_00471020 [Trypanosoma grayi]|uniref:hypothetical protein n=1 Tax=Trypanosoma grayi TaxID=71804 RepID=UPI0004F42142|nr:hypothetical protein DQ04_00471020 [Trypanosoma grayi]KEG14428.1 hypothetical protein DQ04_00471020 [Trypanosoma grayi]
MPTNSTYRTNVSQDARLEYAELLEKLHTLQAEWHEAASRKAALQASVVSTAAHCSSVEPIRQRFSELQAEMTVLNQQKKFIQSQLDNAHGLYKSACEKSAVGVEHVNTEKQALEEEYMQVMRLIDQFDPDLQEDAVLVKAALAEQRVEMRILQEALWAVQQSLACESLSDAAQHAAIPFVPHPPLVEVPMDEVCVPVAPGRLRLLTGPRGDGLQELRERHKVMAYIATSDDAVSVRVQGHSAGVQNCVRDIRRILSL